VDPPLDPALLAERRAVRAEQAEQELLERLRAAERRAVEAQARLEDAERRMAAAEREKARAEHAADEVRRELRRAEQREFAEQQRRIETEEELSGELHATQQEAAELAERAADADRRAHDATRESTRRQEALTAALRRAEAAERRNKELEAMLGDRPPVRPPGPPGPTRTVAPARRTSSATGGGVRMPTAPSGPSPAELDAAAARLREEVPPPADEPKGNGSEADEKPASELPRSSGLPWMRRRRSRS
jgi:hypothetical protein